MPAADIIAISWFLFCWAFQSWATSSAWFRHRSLNHHLEVARRHWMERMSRREVRIVDTQIMASLQNGTAFFASTSLLAIGATFSLFNASDRVIAFLQEIPLIGTTTRPLWEMRLAGLLMLYAFAFYKFGWAYRLFNYTAILIGCVPPPEAADTDEFRLALRRASAMNIEASQYFNSGQRAFFLAIGYLGWFAGPYVLMVTSTLLLVVLLRRQYMSSAERITADLEQPDDPMPDMTNTMTNTGTTIR